MACSSIHSNMVRAKRNFKTEMHIKDNIKITDLMALEHTHGSKDKLHTKVVSRMVSDMVKANGLQDKQNIQVAMLRDSSKVMVNCTFQAVTFTRVTF